MNTAKYRCCDCEAHGPSKPAAEKQWRNCDKERGNRDEQMCSIGATQCMMHIENANAHGSREYFVGR